MKRLLLLFLFLSSFAFSLEITRASLSPDNPAVNETLIITVSANSTTDAIYTSSISILRDGVNQSAYYITNNSYVNGTNWTIFLPLNWSINMQSDIWAFRVDFNDSTANTTVNSTNVTTSEVYAKIPNIFSHQTNGTFTIASSTKNWITADSFSFTEPFGADQGCFIQSTFYSSAAEDLDGQYRLELTSPVTSTSTYIRRSLQTNKFASIIMGGFINISASQTYTHNWDFAKINSTPQSMNVSNGTAFFVCMHDANTNTSLDYNQINFTNSTSSNTFVPIYSRTITTTDRGYRIAFFSNYQITSDSDATVETYASINISYFTKNGSTDYMGLTAITAFSDGDYFISGEKIDGGVNATYTFYAKTTNGTATFNLSGGEFAYQTSELGEFLVLREYGLEINTTNLSSLGPIIYTPLTYGRTLTVVNAISVNNTGAEANATGKTNITDGLDYSNESLIMRRTVKTGQPGKIHIASIYPSLNLSDSTYEAWASSTPFGTAIPIIGGSRVFFAATETQTIETNLTCGILAASNQNYLVKNDLDSNSTCFNITGNNIVLDCNGYSISGYNSSGQFGIFIQGENATVTNCTIIDYETGIGTNSSNLTAYYNNITTRFWINDSGINNKYNNSIGGNIYYFINKTPSWEVYNITTNLTIPNWANNGSDYPFSTSTVSEWIGNGNDSRPWTGNSVNYLVASLFYPYNGTFFGPGQCSITAQLVLASNDYFYNKTSSCRLYTYSGAANETYELIATNTKITTDGIQNFSFNITPSSNQSFRINCSVNYLGNITETNTQSFTITGQSLCTIPLAGNSTTQTETTYIYEDLPTNINNIFGIFFIILGMYGLLRSITAK